MPPAFDLQIAYWTYVYQYPSHRDLHSGAERAARESLNFYIMGQGVFSILAFVG